jgi:hypothetical protein
MTRCQCGRGFSKEDIDGGRCLSCGSMICADLSKVVLSTEKPALEWEADYAASRFEYFEGKGFLRLQMVVYCCTSKLEIGRINILSASWARDSEEYSRHVLNLKQLIQDLFHGDLSYPAFMREVELNRDN